jgi:hypothetical protein
MPLKTEVLDRLLLSKSFLEKIRFQPVPLHDRYTLAANIIAAHDAAELALAGICDQLGCLPQQGVSYLMHYFESLKQARNAEVSAREYFRNLNEVRNSLKHKGLFPDARQWSGVGEKSFQHISKWCEDYLQESFTELDQSALLSDPEVQRLYDKANQSANGGDCKATLEILAVALSRVFDESSAFRGLEAGRSNAEDAIRVVSFGIHGNDFLALQQLLPYVSRWGADANIPKWEQSKYGHPGNWSVMNADFCLRTFIDVAIKLQGAQWIPGPLPRSSLYDQQIETLKDNVEFWRDVPVDPVRPLDSMLGAFAGLGGLGGHMRRETKQLLPRKGEKLRAMVNMHKTAFGLIGGGKKNENFLNVMLPDTFESWNVRAADVKVTCVPKEDEFIRQYFEGLPEIDWEPE